MNVFERSGDLVGMSAVSDLVNGWPGGIIQASRHAVFVTPIYLVNQLYNDAPRGANGCQATSKARVRTRASGGHGRPRARRRGQPFRGRPEIYVKAVNTDLERPLRTRISLRGARVAANATLERVVAGSLVAANGFRTPNAVRVTRESVSVRNGFVLDLPRHSVSVLTLTLER